MVNAAPSTLAPELLARRLVELTGAERDVQVDFLLHLDEFDRRRAFLEAGYDSLWTYCLAVLHLREGPAGRRIAAMRALRRFPALEAPLRDGRLCLTTVTVLGPVLTPENLDDLVERAAYRTKAEVERLAVGIQPRAAPKDGVRKLADPRGTAPHPGPLPASRGEGEGPRGTSLALTASPRVAPAGDVAHAPRLALAASPTPNAPAAAATAACAHAGP